METTNSIKHVIDVNNKKHNYKINIQLNDECRNGHEDFSLTATFWLPNKPRINKYFTVAGCCHEEILKVRRDLKIFTQLHLCDFRGYESSYVENAFYHLKDEYNSQMKKTRFMERYFVSEEQYQELLKADDVNEFGYLFLVVFKNHKIWEDFAIQGIKYLEELSGKKFESKATRLYDISKFLCLSYPKGYFFNEAVKERRLKAHLLKKHEAINKLKKEAQQKIEEIENKLLIEKQLMELDFLDLRNTRHNFKEREFHINVKKSSIGSYKIENDNHAYCFTEDDYNRMHIELPAGYKLIFNNYETTEN